MMRPVRLRFAPATFGAVSSLLAGPLLAGEIKGRVVLDAAPVPGVTVTAVPSATSFQRARREARRSAVPAPLASTPTRADGSFSLVVSGAARTSFQVRVGGAGVVPVVLSGSYETGDVEDVGDLEVAKAGVLAGRIVDARGAPVARAEVALDAGGPEPNAELSGAEQETVTGVDGVFRFDAAASAGNRLTVHADGLAPLQLSGLRAGSLAKPLVLSRALSLSGLVVRSDGKTPAGGVLVRFEGPASTRWVETGADGHFRLTDVPPGMGRLTADAGTLGRGDRAGVHAEGAPEAGLRLVLYPPASIEGRVVDARSAQPVPRVRIEAHAGGESESTRSGPDGRYRLVGLRPARYRIEAEEPRYVPYTRSDVLVTAGSRVRVDLPLTQGATLSGRVVDDKGLPVAGATGRLARAGEGGFGGRRGRQRFERAEFRTGRDGAFKASRLPPGANQRLTVTHPEHEGRVMAGLNLPPGGTKANVTIVLGRGLTLEGIVRDAANRPVAGVDLLVRPSLAVRPSRGLPFLGLGPGGEGPRARSGPDGRFAAKGLSAGAYALTARRSGYADDTLDPIRLEPGEAAAPVEVHLSPGATISGFVRQTNGAGAEGYRVVVLGRGRAERGFGGPEPREPTGPDGAFTLEGLQAGEEYTLLAVGPGGPGPRRESVQAPAEGVEITVAGRGGITGRVLDARAGTPVTDFVVSYEPEAMGFGGPFAGSFGRGRRRRPGPGDTDADEPVHSSDGAFTLADVPAGTWAVAVQAPRYEPARIGGVIVRDGATTDGIEVRAVRGLALRGRVSDARTGRAIPDAVVSADATGASPTPAFGADLGDAPVRTNADRLF
jgi:Carboxypeptidase regulatory-like domain